jgi:diaminopimelate epimerase
VQFTKMHGAGNDYIYVDGFREHVADPPAVARAVSDRHFGVGGDGLILILPSTVADVRMRMFNADGSEAEMCGNGVRCVAKYAYDHGLARTNPMRVETRAGVKTLDLRLEDGRVAEVEVEMGAPRLAPAEVPVRLDGPQVVDRRVVFGDGMRKGDTPHFGEAPVGPPGAGNEECPLFALAVTCVSMGNPHCVIFVDDVETAPVTRLGPLIERAEIFPERTNVEFVSVVSRTAVEQRTWERGSGETLACGTGASAVLVAGVLTGRTEREIAVRLRGGTLRLRWPEGGPVFLAGNAVEVFSGDWPGT